MNAIIETENLSKTFTGTPVINRVNLRVPQGTIYGLVGPNGAGKSTLLKLLIGYYWPTSGTIRLFGNALPKEAAMIRQQIHWVSPEWDVSKSFRIDDLIKYYKLLYPTFDEVRCLTLLNALELPQRAHIRNLSLGMKTQLQLVLALASHPSILLLDEPTNGLDPVVKRQFLQLLVQEAAVDGTTIVLATHHLDDLDRIADGVALMHHGRLTKNDTVDALKTAVKELQFVIANDLPGEIHQRPEVLSCQQRGQFCTLVVEGKLDSLLQLLQSAGALHIQVNDLPFDELFRRLLEKEGYSRDSLLL